jgi:hypothetical protein
MSGPYGASLPSHLASALTIQQGATPVTILHGSGALNYALWRKAILLYIQQRYRTGHTSAPRMEILLAEICAHLSGGLEQWHVRSWQLSAALHLGVLADWVTWGKTTHDRAVRCRQAIRSVSVEDLVGSRLLSVLCHARAQYYMYHPSCLPVIKTRIPLTGADGNVTLITEESVQGALAQARLDDYKHETAAELQHAFHVHLGDSPGARFTGTAEDTITPMPFVRVAEERAEPVEPGKEGDSRAPPVNPFAPPPSVRADPLDVPPSSSWFRSRPTPPARPQPEINPDTPAAAAPSASRPAASTHTAATNVTRTVIRKVHGEYSTIRPLCASAGTLWVDHQFKGTQQQSPG